MRISLEILKQCSSNLASKMYITKEAKWHLLCCCHGNHYAAGPVLIKAKIPRFYLKQRSSTPYILMGRVKTIWKPCVPRKTLCTTCKSCKWRYLLFHRKRLEPRVLPWQQHNRYHLVSFLMYFLVPNLKNTAPIFLEIFLIQYFIVQV